MDNLYPSRIPPQNIEAEQSVLGCILLDKSVLDIVCDILVPEAFYSDNHKIIYSAMLSLYEKNMPVDIVTVCEELNASKKLEKAGGIAYITSLVEQVPTTSNVEYYAKIVEDKYRLRKLINATYQIQNWAYQTEENVDEILDRAEQTIFNISTTSSSQHFHSMKEIVESTWTLLEKKTKTKGLMGISSGFRNLDKLICGFQEADLIIIAGRPSMGKTAFALNIAQNVALQEKIPVAFFSLEMTKEQLGMRMICSQAMVDQQGLKHGNLLDNEWRRISSACNILHDMPMFIDETSNITPMEVRSRARRLKAEKNIGLIIIDYLQLMSSNKKVENRVQEITEISRSLKSIAKDLKIPVIALSQLSREIERRKDRAPLLSDLRESGALEQDADIVMFVHRKGVYDFHLKEEREEEISEEEKDKLLSPTKIIVAKQRNGPIGSVELYFYHRCGRFEVLERNIDEETGEIS